jgi:hypothetical protein
MAKKYQKTKHIKCVITEDLYNDFVKKLRSEGWTVQEAVYRLIYYYTHDRFDIKRK